MVFGLTGAQSAGIGLYIDASGAKKGAAEFAAATDKAAASAGKVERSLTRTEAATKRFGATMSSTALRVSAGFASIATVTQALRVADTFQNIENRLKLVTTGSDNLAEAQRRLLDIAQQTRVDYEATATIFARVARSSDTLGASQEDLFRFTERLNKAIVLSGASSSEASSGLIQLSQAMASGVLRGEEFNSVMEQLPYIAGLIADELGVTTDKLRGMAQQGQITSKAVFNAISNSTKVESEFAQIGTTLGQSWEVFTNGLQNAVAEALRLSGITDAIAKTLTAAGNALSGSNRQRIDDSDRPERRLLNQFYGDGGPNAGAIDDLVKRSQQEQALKDPKVIQEFLTNLEKSQAPKNIERLGEGYRKLGQWAREYYDANQEGYQSAERILQNLADQGDVLRENDPVEQAAIKAQQALRDAVGETSDAYKFYIEQVKEAARANEKLAQDAKKGADEQTDLTKQIDSSSIAAQQFGAEVARGIFDSLQRSSQEGAKLKDVIADLSKTILDIGLSALGSLGGGGLGGIGSIFGGVRSGASGAVDTGTTTKFFARGGASGGEVFNRPTHMRLRDGRMAQFGENGGEGVFPLTRDASGDLAIKAVGGGGSSTTVNHYHLPGVTDARGFRAAMRHVKQDTARNSRTR